MGAMSKIIKKKDFEIPLTQFSIHLVNNCDWGKFIVKKKIMI
jgi:hypothetical protein